MSTILLIDLSSIAHPMFHTSASNPDPNATSIKTVARVRALASGRTSGAAVCCDSGRSFRRDVDALYKANRPPSDATLQHQITLAIETLKADGFPVWSAPGFEADDLIASAAMGYLRTPSAWADNPSIIIASADKDLLQLVGPRVTVKSLSTGNDLDEEAVIAKYGVRPDQMRDYLSLVGDSSDNIKGAEGIGPKKAAAMLARYGNLDDLYAALDAGEAFQPATVKALTEFRGRMETVRSLVTLRTDVPLPFEEVFKERVPSDVAVFEGEETMEAMNDEGPKEAAVLGSPEGAKQAEGTQSTVAGQVTTPIDPMAKLAQDTPKQEIVRPAPTSQGAVPSGLMLRDSEVLPPPSGDFGMQLEPRSLREASLLAQAVKQSMLFSTYGSWQGVLTTILAGRELGMQAMASLRAFHIIEGKPTMSADLIRALVLKSGHAEYFRCTERTATQATFVTKRKGDPEVSLTFTLAEGRQAWPKDQAAFDKSGWGKNPADMCVARASAKLARLVYADIVFNMYTPEEIE